MPVVFTSAKDGHNVEQAFASLAGQTTRRFVEQLLAELPVPRVAASLNGATGEDGAGEAVDGEP